MLIEPSLIPEHTGFTVTEEEVRNGPASTVLRGETFPVQPLAVTNEMLYVFGVSPVKIPVLLVMPPGLSVNVEPAEFGEVTVIVPSPTVGQLVAVEKAVPTNAGPAPTTKFVGVTVPTQVVGGTVYVAE